MTHDQLAGIFEEWQRRYQEAPETFMDCVTQREQPPATYGEGAALYFMFLVDELEGGVK